MKITFVALGTEQLAISLLSNMAKEEGHQVGLAFCSALFHDRFNLEIPSLNKYFDDTELTVEMIRQQNPDVLVCSALTATYQWMLDVAREAKRINPNVVTIFGGVHVSAVPNRALMRPEVDYVVVGEGEESFLQILNAIEKKDRSTPIPNTHFINEQGEIVRGIRKPFSDNLDRLPPFTKELYEPFLPVADHYITMASRGCPYRCTFCFNNFFAELPETEKKGKYVRYRSIEHVLLELKYVKNRYRNLKLVDFEDDVFTANKKWLLSFLPRYKEEIGVPFQCLTHPRHMDAEIANMLKEAGCTWVQMGIQTMGEEFKETLRRNERTSHIRTALKAMLDAGLKVKVDQMLGLPGEPLEAQESALKLYAENCPARIQTFWTCFLPGTELMAQGIKSGLVSESDAEKLNEGEDFYFFRNPDNIKNPNLVKSYEGYELLFKVFPLLPRFIRLRIREKHVRWIPKQIKSLIGKVGDITNAIVHFNPDFFVYAKYYLFHLSKVIRLKLGWSIRPCTIPRNTTPFDFSCLSQFREVSENFEKFEPTKQSDFVRAM